MAILPIIKFPDPLLKEKSVPVEGITPELSAVIDDLVDTMRAEELVVLGRLGTHRIVPELGMVHQIPMLPMQHEAELAFRRYDRHSPRIGPELVPRRTIRNSERPFQLGDAPFVFGAEVEAETETDELPRCVVQSGTLELSSTHDSFPPNCTVQQ